jgi:transposase
MPLVRLNLTVPLTLVLDNARYQICALVQTLARALNIERLYLPAYSPNLNLIERLWKFVK